jgi:PKHD-type hydroxylase
MDLNWAYYYFQNIISKENCNKIIELGLNQIKEDKKNGISTVAVTHGDKHKGGLEAGNTSIADKTVDEIKSKTDFKNTYVRDSEISWLGEKWIYDLLHPLINEANEKAGWKYEWDRSENLQFTKYGLNQFYGWHADGNNDHMGIAKKFIPGVSPVKSNGEPAENYTRDINLVGKIRKLSMTLNLSDETDYEGGNLKFDLGPHSANKRYHECTEIRPKGSVIVFPSHVYHQVTPVTKGTRYSLVMWSWGRPYK